MRNKINNDVETILTINAPCRDSDGRLYSEYVKLHRNEIKLDDYELEIFCNILENMAVLGLPQFETISRARRKVQETNTQLASSKEVAKMRKDQKDKYYFIVKDKYEGMFL